MDAARAARRPVPSLDEDVLPGRGRPRGGGRAAAAGRGADPGRAPGAGRRARPGRGRRRAALRRAVGSRRVLHGPGRPRGPRRPRLELAGARRLPRPPRALLRRLLHGHHRPDAGQADDGPARRGRHRPAARLPPRDGAGLRRAPGHGARRGWASCRWPSTRRPARSTTACSARASSATEPARGRPAAGLTPVDAVTLDRTLAELRPLVVGRHLSRPRLAGGIAVAFEVSGSRDRWLWLDAGRGTAGVYWLPREAARRLRSARRRRARPRAPGAAAPAQAPGRRAGRRPRARGRGAGGRARGRGRALALRLGGSAPALSLVARRRRARQPRRGARRVAPAPESPEREWDRLDPAAFEAAVAAARAEGRSLVRAVLAACPGLGPRLARETDGSAASFAALARAAPRRGADAPRPGARRARGTTPTSPTRRRSRSPRSPPRARADRAAALVLARGGGPLPRGAPPRPRVRAPPPRRPGRGAPADPAPRAARGEPRAGPRGARRRGRPAAPGRGPPRLRARGRGRAASRSRSPDPYDPGRALAVALDPAPRGPRQRRPPVRQGAAHRAGAPPDRAAPARDPLGASPRRARREALVLDARDTRELPGRADDAGAGGPRGRGAGPRHYLTSPRAVRARRPRRAREPPPHLPRGAAPRTCGSTPATCRGRTSSCATTRAGRGRTTCARRPRWRPSSARRAASRRWTSTSRGASTCRPARGGPGRVFVGHSDTLRVAPRDPEGRLRHGADGRVRHQAGRRRTLAWPAERPRPRSGLDSLAARVVATAFGAGYSPFAPGTAGSAVGLLLFWPLAGAALALAARGRRPSLFVHRHRSRRAAWRACVGPEGPGHRGGGRGGGPVGDPPPCRSPRSPPAVGFLLFRVDGRRQAVAGARSRARSRAAGASWPTTSMAGVYAQPAAARRSSPSGRSGSPVKAELLADRQRAARRRCAPTRTPSASPSACSTPGSRSRRGSRVADDLALLESAFREALSRADVVIATGGLGPTEDDLTREAAAAAPGAAAPARPGDPRGAEGALRPLRPADGRRSTRSRPTSSRGRRPCRTPAAPRPASCSSTRAACSCCCPAPRAR